MMASAIFEHELSFHTTGKALNRTYTLSEKEVEIPGLQKKMRYFRCTPADGNEEYYYKKEYPKKKIVLHFTAGFLKGDIEALTKHDQQISVAFVIGRNGNIYNLFQSSYWSYHLGKCDQGDNSKDSQQSVGIEISNIGPLKLVENKLLSVYDDLYCELTENQFYQKISEPFRGYQYFASFTNDQYNSLVILLQYLTAKYQIPAKFLPENLRFETSKEAADFEGIVSHLNFRKTGKWDIGPAFNWQLLEQNLL